VEYTKNLWLYILLESYMGDPIKSNFHLTVTAVESKQQFQLW